MAFVSDVWLFSHRTCPATSVPDAVGLTELVVSKVKDSVGVVTVIEST